MNSGQKDVTMGVLTVFLLSALVTMYDSQGPSGIELVFTSFVDHVAEFWLPALALLGGLALVVHLGGGSLR